MAGAGDPFGRMNSRETFNGPSEQQIWQELQGLELPAYPASDRDGWLRFETTAATKNRFFIDRGSISAAEDGVVRYALIIESPSGVRNISYEGMRCKTAELKQYAWGTADGKWFEARSPQWRPIVVDRVNAQHAVLYERYLCNPDARGKVELIVKLLQSKDGRDLRSPASVNPARIFAH